MNCYKTNIATGHMVLSIKTQLLKMVGALLYIRQLSQQAMDGVTCSLLRPSKWMRIYILQVHLMAPVSLSCLCRTQATGAAMMQ